jgi:hypothetical protein
MSSAAIRSTVRALEARVRRPTVVGRFLFSLLILNGRISKILFREAWQQMDSPNQSPFSKFGYPKTEFMASFLSVKPVAGHI